MDPMQPEFSSSTAASSDAASSEEKSEKSEESASEPEIIKTPSVESIVDEEEVKKLALRFKKITQLFYLNEKDWTSEHDMIIWEFCKEDNSNESCNLLTVFYLKNQLTVKIGVPRNVNSDIFYFVKNSPGIQITTENILDGLSFGSINEVPEQTILDIVKYHYSAMFLNVTNWPNSVKNELCSSLNSFVEYIDDLSYKMMGLTSIYVPLEAKMITLEQASRDRHLVKRIESCVLSWICRVRMALGDKDQSSPTEMLRLVDEIEFWKYRYKNLSGCRLQLDDDYLMYLMKILSATQSPDVNQLEAVSDDLDDALKEAESNFQYLHILEEPANELMSVKDPRDMIPLLPKAFFNIKLILESSPYYDTSDKAIVLYSALSNLIIVQCTKFIDLSIVFEGKSRSAIAMLKKCIDCCQKYKFLYKKTQDIYRKNNEEHCKIDENDQELIFNQVNTFIQRCKDVLEICDCMITFARMDETVNMPKPEFGLTKGFDLEKICEKVEADFIQCLAITEKVQDTILDVRSPVWYEEILRFRKFVKNLEMVIGNLFNEAFSVVTNVFEGLNTLQSLYQYSKQPNLYSLFEQRTIEVYKMYIEEIHDARSDLVQSKRQHPSGLPRYAGRALIASLKRKRIVNIFKQLEESEWMISVPLADEVQMQYQKLLVSVESTINLYHKKWLDSLQKMKDVKLRLRRNLVIRSPHRPGLLENNIDRKLISIYKEAFLWMKLDIRIPVQIDMILNLYPQLRVLNGGITKIVIHYNRIIQSLSDQERVLFREMLNEVDMKIKPGIVKYDWELEEETSNQFVSQCLLALEHLQDFINSYKTYNLEIVGICDKICNSRMLDIPVSRTYELRVVQQKMSAKRKQNVRYIVNLYNKILRMLQIIFEEFSPHLGKMEVHLRNYFQKVDSIIQESFVICVRESLKNMYKIIHGDGIGGPCIYINVLASIKNREITFSPSMIALIVTFQNVHTDLVLVINLIPRLIEKFNIKERVKTVPYSTFIANDAGCIEIQHLIEQELVNCFSRMKEFVKSWKVYRLIWEKEKKLFLEKYESRRPKAECFDRDIGRYSDLIQSVEEIEPRCPQQFLLINCENIKDTIIKHCKYWQFCLIQILSRILNFQIEDLYRYTVENAHRLSFEPKNPITLHEYTQLLENLNVESQIKSNQFASIRDKMLIFSKYDFSINPIIVEREAGLDSQWSKYITLLQNCGRNVDSTYETFKTTLIDRADTLRKDVKALLSEFSSSGPFTSALATSEAIARLKHFRRRLEAFKKSKKEISQEFIIFAMEYQEIPEIDTLNEDLSSLEVILKIADRWDRSWDENKIQNFWLLDVDKMEMDAQATYRQLNTLFKELRDKHWEIIDFTRKRVETFIKLMPLINDLKNKALRDRHWDKVRKIVGSDFDEKSDEFTLEVIRTCNMHLHGDIINDISDSATRELQIENNMKAIKDVWESVELELAPHKNTYRVIKVDDIYATLEEHLVSIAAMKSTRFVEPFFKEVDQWEKNLALILEILDGILNAQRKYLYLENIFTGEDIRCHLPKESNEFDACINEWCNMLKKIKKDRYALEISKQSGLLKKLQKLDMKLELIQKALEAYLETKRNIFPRFYFISNDDMLEILGSSKKPEQVQPHLKKCFDNISKVRISKIAPTQKHDVSTAQRFEINGMFSADGEFVEFGKPVVIEGSVESWLCNLETAMRVSLHDHLKQVRLALRKNLSKRDKWIRDYPGQLCITSSQIQWTIDCTRSLLACKLVDSKFPLKKLRKKQNKVLSKYSDAIRGNLNKLQRLKVVALVTIEIHARDVIEKMYKANCKDVTAFEWLAQLRFYWDRDVDDCTVRQTNTKFLYGYEYLGNSGRLVITPLTDRCYITLTTALHLHRGGSPKGPAGTGKTETVKDLGKALAYYVIVINCSEGLDFKSMGHMFSGFAQSGAWGCFDEFNRINIEVLSVVAQQILSILSALTQGLKRFNFEGKQIKIIPTCGIFITMNPGYAGRTELPDNLKSMFRPISMMVPDCMLIAEITLFGEGFRDCRTLAKKVDSLFSLARQQLSKQDHYDFGLRGMVSLLRYAGRKRRAHVNLPDDSVVLLAIRDMNVAKLACDDLPLFNGITQDLFPGIELPTIDYQIIIKEIQRELASRSLQDIPIAATKVIQLYETKISRHSVMLVGKTGAAKSTTWKVLRNVLTSLKKENVSGYESVTEYPINPKALDLGELYGEYSFATGEWTDGVLSSVMRKVCADEGADEKWILFDGPVDAVWIENMNSVMDDNKVLTLINSERITMPEQVSLLFEVEDLSVASPATVSRCGMVYNDYKDFGWEPFVNSWLEYETPSKDYQNCMKILIDRFLQRTLDFVRLQCDQLIVVPEISVARSLCRLLSCLATSENGLSLKKYDIEVFESYARLWFLFCLTWSVCAVVDEEGRKKVDGFIRDLDGSYPMKDTIYEYYVDVESCSFKHWELLLPINWKLDSELPFYKIIVPTVDTLRYEFVSGALIRNIHPVLLVGAIGTGKTQTALSCVEKLDTTKYTSLMINMSAQTSSKNIQDAIESRVEKRTKGMYMPVGGKRLLTFMDDFNMPAKEIYGAQPPLELIRHWMDYGFWYDRQKQFLKYIKNMQLIAAMGPPGGGRNQISNRLLSRFTVINFTFPNASDISQIYGTMLSQHTSSFDDSVKQLWKDVTEMTVKLYMDVSSKMLPTPAKMHYLFNMRDISKIFQGLLRSTVDYQNSRTNFMRLWIHESFRVFGDRLINEFDIDWLTEQVNFRLGKHLDLTLHGLCPGKEIPIFSNFLNPYQFYEDIQELQNLKYHIEKKIDEYNISPSAGRIDLVLFKDAINHICRISRVISQPRGNLLLVGTGGSGRQSLSRISAFICEYVTFQIQTTKSYSLNDFKEDLKSLYFTTGIKDTPTSFLFVDNQISEETFLEIINNILSTGEVSNLYKPEEFEELKMSLVDAAIKVGKYAEQIYGFFIERVRANLHIIVCLSPIGESFRSRLRQCPSLVNCTTINWILEWPKDALLEVANRFLNMIDLCATIDGLPRVEDPTENITMTRQERLQKSIGNVFATMHTSVSLFCKKMGAEYKRYTYVTAINYLGLMTQYIAMLDIKREEVANKANKLRNGVWKIDETREKVEEMSVELEKSTIQVDQMTVECEGFLVVLRNQKKAADDQQRAVAARSVRIKEEEKACRLLADVALADLQEAMPALEEAIRALEALNKKDITEIRSYGRPPAKVEMVMEAVMILKQVEPTWAEAKRQLGDVNFLNQLKEFDKDHISDRTLKKIAVYTSNEEFEPEKVGIVSAAAKSLCLWVRAIEKYGKIYRIVAPKKAKLDEALASLNEKQAALAEAMAKLDDLHKLLEKLKQDYDERMAVKEDLRKKAELLKLKLERAAMLVDGLSGEKTRWTEVVATLDEKFEFLIGDCLLSTAFLSYIGPFMSHYREKLMVLWKDSINQEELDLSPDYDLVAFLSDQATVQEWNMFGLPTDMFSTENGLIITKCAQWPLIIDPQGQAQRWIRNMERGLIVVDSSHQDISKVIEEAVIAGNAVLVQNLSENFGSAGSPFQPILSKKISQQNGKSVLRYGDRYISYNRNFRLFLLTKLANPHFPPETSTVVNLVNFTIKEEGLEAQLLGIVVRKEKPKLEEDKIMLVQNITTGKRMLIDLEDELLRLLNESEGSLLDNLELINTLQTSKHTSTSIQEQLQNNLEVEIKIDSAREGYRECAKRASILFFVLNDLAKIDPMYQFSLDWYLSLFILSINKSTKSESLPERLRHLNDYHTYSVYRNACRTLFEKHKLLFSFHTCVKILESAQKIIATDYDYLLKGGVVLNRESQPENPCSTWMGETEWDNITELDKLPGFHGVVGSFEQYSREWKEWFLSTEPEKLPLIGEWQNICKEFQRMLFIRALRSDRLTFCISSFVASTLGERFTEPPVLDIKSVLEDSNYQTPLVFVLSPGADPAPALIALTEKYNMSHRFHYLSLGQGQAPIATLLIQTGLLRGDWIFLANCHLSLSWMPKLDKIIENIAQNTHANKNFRLWLSSSPHPEFPISILQNSLKMTTEPPKGIKANMKRLYQNITEAQFDSCSDQSKYKRLLYALCFFHSILIERKKFQQLGWNIIYSFNDSDFEVSENLLSIYLDEYPDSTPFDALKYLIAGVNYGGHVTDDWDRRLLMSYVNQYFCEDVISVPFHRLSDVATYYIPKDGSLQSYKDFVVTLPNIDHPQVFGQHTNADITSLIVETKLTCEILMSLQSQSVSKSTDNIEESVMRLANDILSKIPANINYEVTEKNIGKIKTPLQVVLLQEIQRYNVLLNVIKTSLDDVIRGIQGFILLSPELEDIFNAINEGRIPLTWQKAYPSLKNLGSWTRDLILRVQHFTVWANTLRPPLLFWLSAYTYPNGFLTAVLQTSARQLSISVDLLGWEFVPQMIPENEITIPPNEGVFIRGMFLEGAGWDKKRLCLAEPKPLQLIHQMPVILFRPCEQIKLRTRGMFVCPTYYFPQRCGSQGREAFVIAVDLKSGDVPPDHWVKRATALLLSLLN